LALWRLQTTQSRCIFDANCVETAKAQSTMVTAVLSGSLAREDTFV
jgi:hypothetical protein